MRSPYITKHTIERIHPYPNPKWNMRVEVLNQPWLGEDRFGYIMRLPEQWEEPFTKWCVPWWYVKMDSDHVTHPHPIFRFKNIKLIPGFMRGAFGLRSTWNNK